MKHDESRIQRSCIKWFRYQYPKHVLFAIPNGGRRWKTEAKIMNGEGVMAGVADLFLAHPSKNNAGTIVHGLFVEMKSEKGIHQESQKDFERKVFAQGYDYEVCRSFDEFKKVVENYLKPNKHE